LRSPSLPLSRRLLSGFAALFLLSAVVAAPTAAAHDSVGGTADVTITIRSGLSDRDVRASVGDVVRFVNRDDERHRMRSRSGPAEFDTGNLEPGEAFQVRLSVAGTYAFADERDRDAVAYRGRILVGGSGGSGSSDAGAAGGGTAGTAPASASVTIGDRVFQPAAITVAAGGSVTFRNADGDTHTATSAGSGGIDSGSLDPGATYEKRFTTAGTFAFLCVFHSDMRGEIRVVAAAAAAPPASSPAVPQVPQATPSPTTSPAPAIPGDAGGEPAPTVAPVRIVDFAFDADPLEIAAGDSVEWTNTGVAPHTVTASDGTFDSEMLDPGATFQQTFETPGTYAYLCAIHPEMQGSIKVVAATTGTAPSVAPAAPAAPVSGGGAAPEPSVTPTTDAAPTAANAAASTGVGGLGGIVLAVTFVSVAVALFAAAIRGTNRAPG